MAKKEDKDATQRVLDMRSEVDSTKTRVAEARTYQRTAEDALTAADDAIHNLGLDPDRDLARQVIRLVDALDADVEKGNKYADEVEAILQGDK